MKKKCNEYRNHKCTISFYNIRPDHYKHMCRLDPDQTLLLSNRYNIDANELFIFFYSLCFKAHSQRFPKLVYGISDSTLSAIFRRVLALLHSYFVPT